MLRQLPPARCSGAPSEASAISKGMPIWIVSPSNLRPLVRRENPAGRASGVFGSASGSASLLLACSAALEQDAQPFLTGRDGPAGHLAEAL